MILVAEDNVMIAMMIEDDLQDAGHAVAGPVATIGEALAIAREGGLTMALVDIDLLYGESGIELAATLKDEHDLPCIFVTGQANEAMNHPDAALGVLAKPFGPDTIARTVDAVLHEKRPEIAQLTWFDGVA